jgi:ABC-type multidrug transport system fused ATPase/permease subunit
VIDIQSEPKSTGKQLTDSNLIEFRNVTMRYREDLKPALKQVSFSIRKGEKIAVVGRTGAGKSSLFQLLTRFRAPQEG